MYLGFALAVKNFANEHRADRESHDVVRIADAVTPLLLATLGADQRFSQTLVSLAEWLRQKSRQRLDSLPDEIIIQHPKKKNSFL